MKYVAKLRGVLDVTLTGTTDLDYWRTRLPMPPLEVNGRAQVMVIAAAARFRGIRFCELSISVAVEGGAFLLQAYNSVRFFAWSERTFFHTPYAHAPVSVSESAFGVEGLVFAQREPRTFASKSADGWSGKLFLEGNRYFVAEIAGETERYPFTAADTLIVDPSLPQFTPDEWLVRRDAMHAKSRTYFAGVSSR